MNDGGGVPEAEPLLQHIAAVGKVEEGVTALHAGPLPARRETVARKSVREERNSGRREMADRGREGRAQQHTVGKQQKGRAGLPVAVRHSHANAAKPTGPIQADNTGSEGRTNGTQAQRQWEPSNGIPAGGVKERCSRVSGTGPKNKSPFQSRTTKAPQSVDLALRQLDLGRAPSALDC